MYSLCCHSCPASHPGGLPLWAPREPSGGWLGASWLTSLAVAGCTPLPPCSSLVRGPGGSGLLHLPPPWPVGAEAVASRRSPGQVLMVGLWAEASGPVLPAPVVVRPRPAGGSPVPPACALGSWWPGRTGRDGGPSRPVAIIPDELDRPAAPAATASSSCSSSSSSSSSSRCRLSPGTWVSALTSADRLVWGLSITCQNLYSFDICRYVPLFPTFHQQKGLSNSFQIRRPGGDTQHLWTFSPVGAGGGPGPGTALR